MVYQIVIAAVAFGIIFILFLVISRTLNSIINYLAKVEYLITKDVDLRREKRDIERLLKNEAEEERKKQELLNR